MRIFQKTVTFMWLSLSASLSCLKHWNMNCPICYLAPCQHVFLVDLKRHFSSEIRIMETVKTTCQHDLTRHPIKVLKTSGFFSPPAFSYICPFLCFLLKLPWEGFGVCDHTHPLYFNHCICIWLDRELPSVFVF